MKTEIICLNSDTINKYNYRIDIGALEQAIKDNFEKGLPMCLGHDRHRPIGLTVPFALYLEPHISRLLGNRIIPTNAEEQKNVNNLHSIFLQKNYQEGFDPYKEKFLALLGDHITEKHLEIVAGCAAILDTKIASRIFRLLFDQKDDIGLLPLSIILNDFIYQGQGIFKHRTSDLSIYADKNFRRTQSVHNNFHFYFLDELMRLADNKDITIKIRIDEDMIGYAPSYHESMELEYHWGPQFTDDISKIKNGITRYECNDFERSYYGVSSNEFYWKTDGVEKTFEMEEVRDQPAPTVLSEQYNCRYMHAIYNTARQEFIHFDGAIRSYTFEEMSERLDKTFLEYGRKASYNKLFRIDGKLPLATWKLLVVHFMQGNPLIYEYFGLEQEREMQKMQPILMEQIKQLLPFKINRASGIRLLISYHNLPQNLKQGRYIDVYDVMKGDNDPLSAVEHTVFEIKKALQKIGEDLDILSDVFILKIDDRYVNIPSIMHHGENVKELLGGTTRAYQMLFKAMSEKGFDKEMSMTLSFIMHNRLVRVSVYGNIIDLLQWMNTNLPFPIEEKEFSQWIKKQRKYLQQFIESSDDPIITSLVQNDGVLYVKRKSVKYPYEFENTEEGLKFKIEFPEGDTEILNLIREDKVEPKLLFNVKEMKWSDTNENYFTSQRSKWLDDNGDAGVSITKWEPLSLYWSKL